MNLFISFNNKIKIVSACLDVLINDRTKLFAMLVSQNVLVPYLFSLLP